MEKPSKTLVNIHCCGDTHVGQRREDNEDQFLIADLNKSMKVQQTSLGLSHQTQLLSRSQGKLLLVADGLGGHSSGERASSLAVDGVANYILNAMDWFLRLNDENEVELIEELKTAFYHSQTVLGAEAEQIPQRRGMATTLTMAFIVWPHMYVVHVGDTRCYLVRDEQIRRLTTDHTIGNLAKNVEADQQRRVLSDDDTKPPESISSALWNVIGGNDKSLEPQVEKIVLQVGDRILLCSDGLTGYVNDAELEAALVSETHPQQICEQFIAKANSLGGNDNITAIVAKIDSADHDPNGCETESSSLESDFVLTQADV